MIRNTIMTGDARELAKNLPDQSVNCIITSPPYFNLRDYNEDGQIGMEDTVGEYICELVALFRELRRALHDSGTLWLNLGDTYAGSNRGLMADGTIVGGPKQRTNKGTMKGEIRKTRPQGKIKAKDLMGIPWRVAFALQEDGWWLRSDIVWEKTNGMPESVKDRANMTHEYMFMLTKSRRYYYDYFAVREPAETGGMRNLRSVWSIPTYTYKGAHFATFPPNLIRPCIRAGTSSKGVCSGCNAPYIRMTKRDVEAYNKREGQAQQRRSQGIQTGGTEKVTLGKTDGVKTETIGWKPSCNCEAEITRAIVLDPFMGSGTVASTCIEEKRDYLGFELSPDYVALANKRIDQTQLPLIRRTLG